MDSQTVGDVMSDGRNKALRSLAVMAGILVYLGMVAYSAVHNIKLLTAGVPPDMVMWALVGVVSLEITALALPIALHWWTHAAMQRIAAFVFYGLDLVVIVANVVIDYSMNTNTASALPGWLEAYRFYLLPASPILCGLGWSLLWLLDPSQRERALVETLRAATRESLAVRVAEQARATDVSELVDAAAYNLARDIVKSTLGVPVESPRTAAVRQLSEPAFSGNGHKLPAAIYQAESVAADPTQGL